MSMKSNEKETLVGFGMFLISVFLFVSVFSIRDKGEIFISPRLVPFIVTSFMILISLLYFLVHAIKGLPRLAEIKESISLYLRQPNSKSTSWSILIVGVYVFFGIPVIGFYISSIGMISFILIKYVRKLHPAWSILISVLTSGAFYLLFGLVLHLSLR